MVFVCQLSPSITCIPELKLRLSTVANSISALNASFLEANGDGGSVFRACPHGPTAFLPTG